MSAIIQLIQNDGMVTIDQKPFSSIFGASSILVKLYKADRIAATTNESINNLEIPIPTAITETVFKESDKGENIVFFDGINSLFDDLNS